MTIFLLTIFGTMMLLSGHGLLCVLTTSQYYLINKLRVPLELRQRRLCYSFGVVLGVFGVMLSFIRFIIGEI